MIYMAATIQKSRKETRRKKKNCLQLIIFQKLVSKNKLFR